jgi:AraC-like DNA-binding protein
MAVVVIFFGAFLALLLSVGQLLLRHKKARNYLLGALLFCTAGWQFHTALLFSELKADFGFYTFFNLPLLFLTGPLLYYYFRQLMQQEIKLEWMALVHALPSIAALIYLTPFYAQRLECKSDFLAGLVTLCGPLTAAPVQIMVLMALVSIILYLALTLIAAARTIYTGRKDSHITEWLALVFIAANIGNTAMCLWGVLTPNPGLVKASAVTVTAVLCFLFLTGLRYERYLNVTRIEAERIKYEKSRLGGLNLGGTLKQLDVLMREKHLYRDENLTLVQLAAAMQMAVQQLSEAINKGLGKNFYQFINEYRIEAACETLLAEPEKNILDVAFSVGFNSKSVFNRVFTQIKTVTPSEFRRGQSGKSH